jgi:hypothetical protein
MQRLVMTTHVGKGRPYVLNLSCHDSIAENTPIYTTRASFIFRQNMQKCGNEAARASITYSWRLCLRNPPPLGRVILDASWRMT